MRVAFIHPDLGIGGAERWLVDSALALTSSDHDVVIYTSHYDRSHCFDETRQMKVICRGDSLPRSLMGRFFALFAYIRMVYLAFYIVMFSEFEHDVIICDQVSACIPVLKMSKLKILFYCHFPDMLLSKRDSLLKKIYRAPIDALEQYTTGLADRIIVNSRFTLQVFRETFTSLSKRDVDILYPSISISTFDSIKPDYSSFDFYDASKTYILSLNRFERKKNVSLAIETRAYLRDNYAECDWCKSSVLIVAGGYDHRVKENLENLAELKKRCEELRLTENEVIFLQSPSDVEKVTLLVMAQVLLYTPSGEHFGIVPVEAMLMQTPVVAVNSGGPLETVVDGVTGYLVEPAPDRFASAVSSILSSPDGNTMGENGRNRVINNFSFETFTAKLNHFVERN